MGTTSGTKADGQDYELIAQLRKNDTVALSKLIRLYVRDLRDVAYGVLRREDLASDVVQYVFVKLWNKRASLDIRGSVFGYLRKMVRDASIDVVRRERTLERTRDAIAQSYMINPPVSTNKGVGNLAAEELQVLVQRTLDTMPPQVREIYLMRRFKEMELDEIASALGISIQTVKSQMSRAVRRLAEELKDWP